MISQGLALNVGVKTTEEKENKEDWKSLYLEKKLQVEALQKKVEEYKNLYEEEQLFVSKLLKKVEELKKLVPVSNEKKKYGTEKENQLAIIQRSFKRRQQTSEFVSLGKTKKKKIFLFTDIFVFF